MLQRWTLALAVAAAASGADAGPISPAEQAAWNHWAMNCQGCHRPDGNGTAGGAPRMNGVVARFLSVDGGRAYLTRVPGVATAPLSDAQLADLLNFVLRHFDGQDLPADFKPYTAEEITAGRRAPLRTEAAETRRRLLDRFAAEQMKNPQIEGGRR
jgi:mono/diheme cytochrome c family protein